MSDEPYPDPEHAIPYLKLIRLGVPTWNKWIKGELTEAEAAEVRARLAPTPVPPSDYPQLCWGENKTVNFSGVRFRNKYNFIGAVFVRDVNFSDSEFCDWAIFKDTVFEKQVSFERAKFHSLANFEGADLAGGVIFKGAVFDDEANFSGVAFGRKADFSGATFAKRVQFSGGDLSQRTFRLHSKADRTIQNKDCRDSWVKTQLERSRFDELDAISFTGSFFRGHAEFRRRQFLDYVNFSHACFDMPPTFENCDGMERMDVTGTRFGFTGTRPRFLWWEKEQYNQFGWTTDSNIPTRLRILRKQMEDIKAHDAERDLFIAERMAERGVMISQAPYSPKTLGALFLFFMYQTLSDCGRSILRPTVLFGFKFAIFFYMYLGLISHGTGERWRAVLSFTIGHALPFVSSLSKVQEDVLIRLFGKEFGKQTLIDMPFCIEILSVGQSLIGALLLFLFLQAVRNHFRLR